MAKNIRGKRPCCIWSSLSDYEEMAVSTTEECDKLIDMINIMLDITARDACPVTTLLLW